MASAVMMPTGWPPFAQDIAQLAWAAPLPASFLSIAHDTSTTSPFTVMSAANAGNARDTTNAAPAQKVITLRMATPFRTKRRSLYLPTIHEPGRLTHEDRHDHKRSDGESRLHRRAERVVA